MALDTNAAPQFNVFDLDKNWFYSGLGSERAAVSRSPREIVKAMQRAVGVSEDGNWGDGTSTALLAYMRRTNAPANLISAVEAVKSSRSLSGSNGLVAWTVAIYVGMVWAPDWAELLRGDVALGSTATLSQVRLPAYGQVAPGPGSSTSSPRPTPSQPVRPSQPGQTPGLAPTQAASSIAQKWSTFYNKNKTAVNIAAALAVAGTGYLVWKSFQEEDGDSSDVGPRGAVSRRRASQAAELLGLSLDSDKQSIRAAAARAMGAFRGDTPSDRAEREIVESARDTMLQWAQQRSVPAGALPMKTYSF